MPADGNVSQSNPIDTERPADDASLRRKRVFLKMVDGCERDRNTKSEQDMPGADESIDVCNVSKRSSISIRTTCNLLCLLCLLVLPHEAGGVGMRRR
ncbi:hypothetical protein MRX96_044222 [Rhipicephalus microplus]